MHRIVSNTWLWLGTAFLTVCLYYLLFGVHTSSLEFDGAIPSAVRQVESPIAEYVNVFGVHPSKNVHNSTNGQDLFSRSKNAGSGIYKVESR